MTLMPVRLDQFTLAKQSIIVLLFWNLEPCLEFVPGNSSSSRRLRTLATD